MHEAAADSHGLTAARSGVVQRRPEAPPRRPTPTGRRTVEATPKDFYEIRSAILNFAPETVREEDVRALTNEQLRSLDFACELAIEIGERFARQQAADPSWSPPAGYPDLVYGPAVAEIEKFRESQVLARAPHATLLATEHFYAEEGGDTPQTKAHWDAAMPKVKEFVWRMELGTAERTPSSLTALLTDQEITEHAYLTEAAWRTARRDPLPPGAGIDPAVVLDAVKEGHTVIPVRLALAAVRGARRVSEEARKDPSEAAKDRVYNVIQAEMESELAHIDTETQRVLTYINSQRVTGGLFGTGTTHENSFWKLLWSESRGRAWKALQRYRSWAGE